MGYFVSHVPNVYHFDFASFDAAPSSTATPATTPSSSAAAVPYPPS